MLRLIHKVIHNGRGLFWPVESAGELRNCSPCKKGVVRMPRPGARLDAVGQGIEAARLDGARAGTAEESRPGEAEDSLAFATGNDYDTEVDRTETAYGKLDVFIELSGPETSASRKESIWVTHF